jgi:hypothetical protein
MGNKVNVKKINRDLNLIKPDSIQIGTGSGRESLS